MKHRKRTEESKDPYQSILKNAIDGYVATDSKGRLIEVNDAYCRLTGYSEDELLAMQLSDLEVIDDKQKSELRLQKIALQGCDRYESKHKHKDGSIFDVEISTQLHDIGDGQLVSFIRDISNRKEIENAFRESEKKYRQLVETAPYGIQLTNQEGKIIFSNPAHHKIQGYTGWELIGKYIWDLMRDDRERDKAKAYYKRLIHEQPAPEVYFSRDLTKDGREIYVQINWDYVRDAKGEIEGIISIVSDITKQKALESKLLQAQKMESIGTLAGGIAHQFNNALSVVMGNTDLLEMNFPDNREIAHYVKEIKTSANWMAKLTAQLLTYARGGKYHAQKISLCDFVRDTLPLTEYSENPAICINTYFADDIFNIEVDPAQLQMVLTNILMNSSEAMEGKGFIRIDCRNEIVTEQIAAKFPGFKSGSYACMTVADDGRGMDEEAKKRVFEPFFTTKFAGRGLGMSTAYGFVKNHNGYIMVDSELGKGTAVKIYLPSCESHDEESMPNHIY